MSKNNEIVKEQIDRLSNAVKHLNANGASIIKTDLNQRIIYIERLDEEKQKALFSIIFKDGNKRFSKMFGINVVWDAIPNIVEMTKGVA